MKGFDAYVTRLPYTSNLEMCDYYGRLNYQRLGRETHIIERSNETFIRRYVLLVPYSSNEHGEKYVSLSNIHIYIKQNFVNEQLNCRF